MASSGRSGPDGSAVGQPGDDAPGTGWAPTTSGAYDDVVIGSRLDHALAWYREELPLRRLVGLLALPALAALTGFGLLVDSGPVPWIMATLTFLAAAEVVSASLRLRRQRQPSHPQR